MKKKSLKRLGLTCQNIFHDGISQEGDFIDDGPHALEVGQYVVHGVRGGFQRELDPGQELRCKRGWEGIH